MAYLRIGICLCLLGLVYGLGGRRTGGLSTRVFSIDQTATDVVNSVCIPPPLSLSLISIKGNAVLLCNIRGIYLIVDVKLVQEILM